MIHQPARIHAWEEGSQDNPCQSVKPCEMKLTISDSRLMLRAWLLGTIRTDGNMKEWSLRNNIGRFPALPWLFAVCLELEFEEREEESRAAGVCERRPHAPEEAVAEPATHGHSRLKSMSAIISALNLKPKTTSPPARDAFRRADNTTWTTQSGLYSLITTLQCDRGHEAAVDQ
jgi:hypothetical protein